jgi:hypothetical protein
MAFPRDSFSFYNSWILSGWPNARYKLWRHNSSIPHRTHCVLVYSGRCKSCCISTHSTTLALVVSANLAYVLHVHSNTEPLQPARDTKCHSPCSTRCQYDVSNGLLTKTVSPALWRFSSKAFQPPALGQGEWYRPDGQKNQYWLAGKLDETLSLWGRRGGNETSALTSNGTP